ncbi:MAG: serine/threonine protein kinase [candidate division Zixibacteria bacterium]|nr:serine/threonine protein kinase [candidate division Zixibacteria bacterium]
MKRLLHYELTEELGRGKNGAAFQALDTGLGRAVVVKMLDGDWSRNDRWQQDYRALTEHICVLHHKSVGPMYGLESDDGQVFVVRDFFDGETVADLSTRHMFDYRRFLTVARSVATGLQAVHERGLLHGNVRPTNVWITASGDIVLSDPGLQIPFDSQQIDRYPLSELMYIAPEQFTDAPPTVQTDLYALGVVLYHLLTGEFPFHGDTTRQLQENILAATIEYGGPAGRFAPPEARLLVNKLLSRDLDDRFADADSVRATLAAMQSFTDEQDLDEQPRRRGWTTRQSLFVSMFALLLIIIWFVWGIITD